MLGKGLKRIISLFVIFVLIATTGMMTVHGRGQDGILQPFESGNQEIELTLLGNGGTPKSQVAKVVSGETLSVALAQITMPYREYTYEWQGHVWVEVHELIGWFTTPFGDGVQIHPTDVITQESPRTLYARWRGGDSPLPMLGFFGNGGTPKVQWICYSSVINATFAEAFAMIEEPTKEGYTFLGWKCWGTWGIHGNHIPGPFIQSHQAVRAGHFDAQWQPEHPEGTLWFFGYGGTPEVQGVAYRMVAGGTFADAFALIEEPTKANHTFLGWSNMNMRKVHGHEPVGISEFYAIWEMDELEPVEYTITFKFYTHEDWIIERLDQERAQWRDGFLTLEVPITPGAPRDTWRDQELLNLALNQGDIQTEDNASGRAFWGWFTNKTLNASGRVSEDSGLRRPALTDQNELENILLQIEEAGDLAARIELFGSNIEHNITLFGLWALWGDVNDDGRICAEDLELMRRYLSYEPFMMEPVPINIVAGQVTLDGFLRAGDFERLRQYLSYGHFPGVNILLGVYVPHR